MSLFCMFIPRSRIVTLCIVMLYLFSQCPERLHAQAGGQMGETVLAANAASADAPKKRGPNHPWVELSNLRKGSDGPFPTLEVDYNITGDGIGMFTLVVKSADGRGGAMIHTFGKKQGTISLRTFGFRSFPENLEVWAEVDAGFGPFSNRAGYKVSKSLALGSVGQLTYAREWQPEEQKAYELAEKAKAPPPPPPAGFVQVDETTAPLLPGMPVLATWMAEWEEAELISVSPGLFTVKWIKAVNGRPSLSPMVRNRTAVSTETLTQGKQDPSRFIPSVKTLEGGTLPLEQGLVPLTSQMSIVPGTPLKAEWGGKWETVTATAKKRGETIPITWDSRPGWNEDRKVTMLAIEETVIQRLKESEAEQFYADRLDKLDHRPAMAARGPARDYPISLPLPKNTTRLKDDLLIPEGTKLGAVWGGKWYELTVLSDSEDGPVECHWENFGGNWNELINRGSLAISKAEETKLRNAAKKKAVADSDADADSDTPSSDAKVASKDGKPAGKSSNPMPANNGERFDVVLESVGTNKIRVAKVIMEITKLELKDALELTSELPFPLKSGISRAQADLLLQKIRVAGGEGKVQAAEE